MRLLLVTPEFPPQPGGGILKYYAALSEALVAAGADVSVLVATPFFSCPDYEQNGVRVVSASADRVQWHADHLTHLAAAPQYRQWIAAGLAAAEWVAREGHRFDVIEVTDFGLLFAPLLTLDSRPPLVVAFHGSVGQIAEHEPVARYELDGALARLTEAVLLPFVDGLYSYGPGNAAEWSRRLGREVEFFPPPLPMPQIASADRVAAGAMSAVVVGRIQSWKGPDLLCQAVRAVGNRLPADLTIQWVGRDT